MGKTRKGKGIDDQRWKHPHVHGEDGTAKKKLSRNMETPPRAWGRRRDRFPRELHLRNTPTCMGKTDIVSIIHHLWWKHPHVHGEDALRLEGLRPAPETPPRAWGRLDMKSISGYEHRNTPTCMGKTHREPSIRSDFETPPRAWGRRANNR